MGFAAFVLNSFGGRGFGYCMPDRRINLGSRIIDAYRALKFLTAHPRIDPSRVALMGFSQGGAVTLLARHPRFRRLWMSRDKEFAAYLAFYPQSCTMRLLDEDEVSSRPFRIFHGTADDWTPIDPCREYVQRMRQAGKDAFLYEYPDAHHGFANPSFPSVTFLSTLLSASRNCLFVEQADGHFAILHRDTGKLASAEASCVSRGVTIGHDPRAHRQAIQDVKGFLEATFRR